MVIKIELFIILALNILLFFMFWRERKHRRILEVLISGISAFLIHGQKDGDNKGNFCSLIFYVKSSLDHAFGASGVKNLEKSNLIPDNNEILNQIYWHAVRESSAELRKVERKQELKND